MVWFQVLIYVHCPDASYIPSIIESEELSNVAGYGQDAVMHAIVHRLGDGVLDDERYKNWMNSFGDHVHVCGFV